MTAMSNYLENEILDHILGGAGGAWPAPSTVYVALFDSNSSLALLEAGTLTGEISDSGTAYTRAPVTWAAASTGSKDNSVAITFSDATANWGTVEFMAIMDSQTHAAGNVLFAGALNDPKTVGVGDTFRYAIGSLIVNID